MEKPLANRFVSGVTWNIIGKILLGSMELLISILIARSLGSERLGVYATLLTIPAIMRLFSTLGFETSLNIKLPMLIAKRQESQCVFLIKRLLMGRIFISLLFCLGLYCALPIFEKWLHLSEVRSYYPYIACYFLCVVSISFVSMVPRALLRIKEVSLLESLNQLGYMIFLCIFSFVFGLTIKGIFVAYIVSTGIVIFIFIFLFRYFYLGNASPLGMREVYEIGVTAAISSFMVFGLGQQIDILLMNFFKVEKGDIGFYYLALSIVAMFAFLSIGMGALSQSSFSEQYAKRGNAGIVATFPLIVKACVLLTVPFGVFGIVFAKDIIYSFYGNDYLGAVSLLQFFAVCWCVQILAGSSFCSPLFYILHRKKTLLTFQLLIGVLNIILDLILIPLYGALGAIVATGISAAFIGVIKVLYLWRKIAITLPWIFELKIIGICIVGVVCACWIKGMGFSYLVVKGIVFLIVFIFVAKYLKPLEESDRIVIRSINPFLSEVSQHF